ncbi:phosphoglycerate mutase-like protein [Mycena alexandri]|uniref:Phosphoglycerate mutase-like protein n=1 Tax=Mycena alexandri TaxID=1745969 RepID=A0AAD6SAP8_9AGAR|nr:phosphoglycerate mutase-like protein [Mycena alexandri]
MPFARIYVVRHGETQENRDSVLQGQLDTQLNETGLEQARRVADALRSVHFDAAYSSDLARALKTAQVILEHRSDIEIRKEEELRERFLGELQGTKVGRGEAIRDRVVRGTDTTEPGEAFAARATGWWKKAILQRTRALPPREAPYNVLVTSHGGLITVLVRSLVGSGKVRPAPGVMIATCRNASVTIIEVDLEGPSTLLQFGDVAHLEEQQMVETNVDEVVVDASGIGK